MKSTSRESLIADEVRMLKPARVLDIAYAHGPNQALAKLGAEVSGIDPLGRTAPFKEMHMLDVNASSLPFPDGTFDVVAMGCVLSHLSTPLKLLAEVNRVLKPNGTIIVSSPNPHYYWETILNLFYKAFSKRVSKSKHEEHFFEFTRYTMRTSLARAGFTLSKEIGSTLQIVKTGLRFDVSRLPGLAFEIIYVAHKTGAPQPYTVIEDDSGKTVRFQTDLFR